MYDHAHPASLGTRDVIAAWLVCLAVAVAVFVYPGFSRGTRTGGSSRFEKRRPGRLADRVVRDSQQADRQSRTADR